MAPCASRATILNYEGEAHDVFNQIAVDNKAKQMTLSYGFGIDDTIRQIFLEFVAQGQSFFQASGDGGADLSGGGGLTGEPYATIVGGTALSTSGAGGPWQSETTWVGSGGGVSSYGIPAWQEGINMQTNQGSTTYRNYPDVALLADTAIFIYFKNGQPLQGIGGKLSNDRYFAEKTDDVVQLYLNPPPDSIVWSADEQIGRASCRERGKTSLSPHTL